MADQYLDAVRKRKNRCFHRVISGLEKGGDLRLITLTSSDIAPSDIQRSFRKLIMRLRRLGLCQDYIKVIEVKDDGREHIHMCYRGQFIAQQFLSELWTIIHQSPVVDIRRVKFGYKNKRGVAGYLAKYMAKELARRYSWSWWWVYKGFCKTWRDARSILFWHTASFAIQVCFKIMLDLWRMHLHDKFTSQGFLDYLKMRCRTVSREMSPPASGFA